MKTKRRYPLHPRMAQLSAEADALSEARRRKIAEHKAWFKSMELPYQISKNGKSCLGFDPEEDSLIGERFSVGGRILVATNMKWPHVVLRPLPGTGRLVPA